MPALSLTYLGRKAEEGGGLPREGCLDLASIPCLKGFSDTFVDLGPALHVVGKGSSVVMTESSKGWGRKSLKVIAVPY